MQADMALMWLIVGVEIVTTLALGWFCYWTYKVTSGILIGIHNTQNEIRGALANPETFSPIVAALAPALEKNRDEIGKALVECMSSGWEHIQDSINGKYGALVKAGQALPGQQGQIGLKDFLGLMFAKNKKKALADLGTKMLANPSATPSPPSIVLSDDQKRALEAAQRSILTAEQIKSLEGGA